MAQNDEKKYHFIGIGGIGMSALAQILIDKNEKVSGSDMSSSYITQSLIESGAEVYLGHNETHVPDSAVVVYSTGIKDHNPEMKSALTKKLPILHRSEMLTELMKGQKTLAVAGTHGKTSTSALLATVLEEAGLNPSFAVGGLFHSIDENQTDVLINGKFGKGDYFVAEADESDGTFLKYKTYGAIVTNAEPEHLDFYGAEDEMYLAFKKFIDGVQSQEHLFWCGDDDKLCELNKEKKGFSYGFANHCNVKLSHFRQTGWSILYNLQCMDHFYENIEVSLTGIHNALNSAAVFALCIQLGVSEKSIRHALKKFKGVGRRCQKKGEVQKITVIDDYGHHPTEISKTLTAIRNAVQEKRIVVIFQPHRYTRTRDCLNEFTHAFDCADALFITDLYSAGEEPIPGISEKTIISNIKKAHSIYCEYLPSRDWVKTFANFLMPHDIVVTIGAGTITSFGPILLEHLQKNSIKKLALGLICGGKSVEHEISLRSAQFFMSSIDPAIYSTKLFKIEKNGHWSFDEANKNDPVVLSAEIINELQKCDVLTPVLHGSLGEDGTIQGLFEILDKAYTGPDFRSAAICMDKALTKRLVSQEGVPTSPFIELGKLEWNQNKENFHTRIAHLRYPLFVKPLHLGSSVGVSRVNAPEQLEKAVDHAFLFDTHILIEEGICPCREIEFAIIGNDIATGYSIEVPPPGEICSEGQVYDYQGKYGANATKTYFQADLNDELKKKGQQLALKAYQSVGLNGMARVDFFLDKEGNFWLNEINPIPGFTSNSLFPKIWELQGLNGEALVDRLVVLALFRKRMKDKQKISLELSE